MHSSIWNDTNLTEIKVIFGLHIILSTIFFPQPVTLLVRCNLEGISVVFIFVSLMYREERALKGSLWRPLYAGAHHDLRTPVSDSDTRASCCCSQPACQLFHKKQAGNQSCQFELLPPALQNATSRDCVGRTQRALLRPSAPVFSSCLNLQFTYNREKSYRNLSWEVHLDR